MFRRTRSLIVLACGAVVLRPAPAGEPAPGAVNRLVAQLGSERSFEREAATRELVAVGVPALAALRKGARDTDDAEVRRRARMLVPAITGRAVRDLVRRSRMVTFRGHVGTVVVSLK